MNVSIGITNAAVFPDPRLPLAHFLKNTGTLHTRLSDTNNVSVLQTYWNSLPLNRRRFLVTNLFNDIEYRLWDCRFCP